MVVKITIVSDGKIKAEKPGNNLGMFWELNFQITSQN